MILSWEGKKDTIKQKILKKKLFVIDLDTILFSNKNSMSSDMESMFINILNGWGEFSIAVISRLKYERMYDIFVKKIIDRSKRFDRFGVILDKLYLLSNSGNYLYRWDRHEGRFTSLYKNTMSLSHKVEIFNAFYEYFRINTNSDNSGGMFNIIEEDNDSQVVFHLCNYDDSSKYQFIEDSVRNKCSKIQQHLVDKLPNFDTTIVDVNSIEISDKGIDKAYCIDNFLKYKTTERIFKKKYTMFIGNCLKRGEYNYSINKLNIDCVFAKNQGEIFEFLVFLAKEVLANRNIREVDFSNKRKQRILKRR